MSDNIATNGNDYLWTSEGDDVVDALGGRDVIKGSSGNDFIDGGDSGYNQVNYEGNLADFTFTQNADGSIRVMKPGGFVDTLKNIGGIWFCDEEVWKPIDELLSPVNTPPVAINDWTDATVGAATDVSVLDNDSDPDGDALTITAINGVAMQPGWTTWVDGTGLVTLNADNTLSVQTVAPGPFSFDYTISDGNGGESTATVEGTSTTGGGGNNPPVATNDQANAIVGMATIVSVLDNDSDPDGDNLTVSAVNGVAMQPGWTTWVDGTGLVTLNADNTLSVQTVAPGPFSFEYTITDGNGGESTATVEGTSTTGGDLNSVDAVDDSAWTNAGMPIAIDVLGNDTDPEGDTFTITNFTNGANSIVTEDADGNLVYTPNAGFLGYDTFTYTITDANGATDTATVTVDVSDQTASIGDTIWVDANGNGIQDAGEAGLGNVTVQLKDANGTVITTQQTAADGSYSFTGLAAGDYMIGVVVPDGYDLTTQDAGSDDAADSDINAVSGLSGIITVAEGETNNTIDGGLVVETTPATSSLGDRVWLDANGNGVQDAGETGVSGVTVNLKDATGAVIKSVVTDANGNYLFDNLAAGTYSVGVVAPDQYGFTSQDAFGNGADGIDSDVDTTTGMTANITLGENEQNLTIDAGLVDAPDLATSSIGNRVWLDANNNGLQDAGEAGLAGVTVQLKDASGAVITTQVTDANGEYLFDGLTAGQYSVGVVNPDGTTYAFSEKDALGNAADSVDSDIDAATGMSDLITLGENEQNLTVDAGLYDAPDPANASIGDRVWFDDNRNGIQDVGEEGVADATVELKDANGVVLETTTTDADGNYLFDNLEAGDYSVGVTAPNHYEFTEKDALSNGADGADSDINADTGMSDVFTLSEGEQNLSIDAGVVLHCEEDVNVSDTSWGEAYNRVAYHGKVGATTVHPGVSFWTRIDTSLLDNIDADDQVVGVDTSEFLDRVREIFGSEATPLHGNPINAHVYDDVYKGPILEIQQSYELSDLMKDNDGTTEEIEAKIALLASEPLHFDVTVMNPDGSTEVVSLCINGVDAPYFPTTPIALDLSGDGEIGVTGDTSSFNKDGVEIGETVRFDIDADGEMDTVEWFNGSGDGILVDMSKIAADGSIDGSALFGDEGGKYENGYEKLALHDADGDGQVSGDELSNIGLWIDDGDAVLEEGELVSAAEQGIASVSTEMEIVLDEDGRELMRSRAMDVDGNSILTEDVWFMEAEADMNEMLPDVEECEDCAA